MARLRLARMRWARTTARPAGRTLPCRSHTRPPLWLPAAVEYIAAFLLLTTFLVPFAFFLGMSGDYTTLPGVSREALRSERRDTCRPPAARRRASPPAPPALLPLGCRRAAHGRCPTVAAPARCSAPPAGGRRRRRRGSGAASCCACLTRCGAAAGAGGSGWRHGAGHALMGLACHRLACASLWPICCRCHRCLPAQAQARRCAARDR